MVREELGDSDPYHLFKQRATGEALALLPRLRELMWEARDPLDTGVRLSIAGNIIDAGIDGGYELWPTVERVLSHPFAVEDLDALRESLARARSVLYLADNAGETVFDRVLIESLELPVVYAAKGGPVINDATIEDARMAGLDKVAKLFSTGSNAPGTILDLCSESFQQLFERAQLVIAKGQANYETLSEQGSKVFFLLQAKCPVIARDLEVPAGSIVLRRGGGGGVARNRFSRQRREA
jgi:uncharacterized protein with ATP-grasp and redox domains